MDDGDALEEPNHASDEPRDDDDSYGDGEFDAVKLRQYQKQRLRYFYAVVECDSVETAAHLYQECDGTEFEQTTNKLDLRFIPEDVEFKNEPRFATK